MSEQPVRVIVTLELPTEATGADFEAARRAALSRLNDTPFSVVREYPRTGQLLIEMQPGALELLDGAPGVRSVQRDLLLRPQNPQPEKR